MIPEKEIQDLREQVLHLKAVCASYDAIINKLPKDELVKFANAVPEEYQAFVKQLVAL